MSKRGTKNNYTSEIFNDPAVIFFAEMLRKQLTSNLHRLILFGSRVRGDARTYSDYDFVIIVDYKDETVVDAVFEVKYELLNKLDVPASGLVYTGEEWRLYEKTPLGINVIREGIEVL